MVRSVITAFQFLTILPLPFRGKTEEDEVGKTSVYFPVVGAFQGLMTGLSAYGSLMLPLPVAACVVIIVPVLINGGFHMDGVADTADALAVKSSGDPATDRERRLRVMKDSSTGAIGATALVLTILLKYTMVFSLLDEFTASASFTVLFLTGLCSKWIMLPALFHGRPARDGGLGRLFMNGTGIRELLSGTAVALAFAVPVAFIWENSGVAALYGFLGGAVLYFACLLSVGFFGRKFGGLTGDTLGALAEMSEIIFLLGVLLWLPLFS